MIRAAYTEDKERGFQYCGQGDRIQAWTQLVLALRQQRIMLTLADNVGLRLVTRIDPDTGEEVVSLVCKKCDPTPCYTHQVAATTALALAIVDSPALSRIMNDHDFVWKEV